VKQKLFLSAALILFLAGCTTAGLRAVVPKDRFYTLQTDLSREELPRAQYYFNMAEAYSVNGEHDRAIEYLRLSLLHDPKLIPAYLKLSEEYVRQNKFLQAMIELNEAQKVEPDNLLVLRKTGDLYLSASMFSKAREVYQHMLVLDNKLEDAEWALYFIYKLERKYTEALATLAKIKLHDGNHFKVVFEKAMVYKLSRDSEMYESTLKEAHKLNPRNREVLLEYVNLSFAKGEFQEATEALQRYSTTHDFDLQISQHLAYAAVQAEVYKTALREYQKQRPFTDDIGLTELRIAHVYYLMGDLENAEKYYLNLINRDDLDEAKFYLAQIYITQQKTEDAAFVLSKLASSSDFFGMARSRLALYKKSQDEADDARNIISDAFIKRTDQLPIYKTYADFLIEDKKFVEATALLEKGIQQFPRDEELRLKMAFLHYRLNNQKSFKKHINAALKINPQSAGAYAMLAELWYLKNKDVDEMIHFVRRAAELKSNNKNIKPILAWALLQKHQTTEAVAIFEEFFEENPEETFFVKSLAEVYKRGQVKQKAKELLKLADRLETNDSLKSSYIFKDNTPKVQSENYIENPTRLPSSLEKQ
jgi:tetratricopeptide (TPR) repeat protein